MPVRHRLGSLDLAIVSDGLYYQDAGAVFGIVPKMLWGRLGIALNERNQMALGLNSVLLRSQGKTVLIETGVGEKERPLGQTERPEGSLIDGLSALGVAPDAIDVVINTHLHADHCGWNTRRDASGAWVPAFPRARYVVQRAEWEAALHPNERTRATYLEENIQPLADAGQVDLVDGEHAVTDEITVVPSFGHSMGHACVVLRSAGEAAVIIGDMAQHPVQLERAPWVSAFDIYPLEAMETKKTTVARAIAEHQLVVAVHGEFPGLGYMSETGGKRAWAAVAPHDEAM